MVYITGDTHAEFSRFSTKHFPEQKEMTRKDYVIICGDFGGIWSYGYSDHTEEYWLKWFEEKPFTLLFVDGNHENFDRLKEFPIVSFKGGKAHKIRNNIYHLMRGYVFNIDGKKFFTFGGARSHDIQDGILDIKDYKSVRDLVNDYNQRTKRGEMLRINNLSWWADELPNDREMKRGIDNLQKANFEVDYVISHCLPQDVASVAGYREADKLSLYFNKLLLEHKLKFYRWYCGHYHREQVIMGKFIIKYGEIERIL